MGTFTGSIPQPAVGTPASAGTFADQVALFYAAFGADTSYVPAWATSGTAPAIGNGTLTGGYTQINKSVTFWAQLTAGSTTTFGTGIWTLTLPVAASTAYATLNQPIGRWFGTPAAIAGMVGDALAKTSTTVAFLYPYSTGTTSLTIASTTITNTTPATWTAASTNTLFVSGSYKAA